MNTNEQYLLQGFKDNKWNNIRKTNTLNQAKEEYQYFATWNDIWQSFRIIQYNALDVDPNT